MVKNQKIASFSTITQNAIWLGVYQLFSGLIQFGFFLLLLRIIPKSHMDIYELGRSCLEIGVGIIGSSVAAVIVRENARNQNWWRANSNSIRRLLRCATLLVGLAIYLLVLLSTGSSLHAIIIGFFCITIYIQSRTELYEAFYRSKDHVKFPVYVGLASSLGITLVTLVCVLFLPYPVIWAAGGICLRFFAQGTILSIHSRMYITDSKEKEFDIQRMKYRDLLMDITPISIGAIAFIIYARIDVLMLQLLGYERMIAIYGCVFRPIGFLSIFISAFYHAFAPSVSKMVHQNPRYALLVSVKIGFMFFLTGLFLGIVIIIFRSNITSFLYPDTFRMASDGFFVMAWSLPIVFGGNAIGFYLVNFGKKGAFCYMFVNILGVSINIIGNYYVIPTYHFIGAAWITVLTDAITTCLMLFSAITISRKKDN